MELTHILIDFENVQPQDMSLLTGDQHRVIVFRGPHQNRLDFNVVEFLQPLGANVKYVRSDRQSKNALDFHIAFYLGRLVQQHLGDELPERSSVRFVVITKDRDFDALLSHLQSLGYQATTAASIQEVLGKNAAAGNATRPIEQSRAPSAVLPNNELKAVETLPKKAAELARLAKMITNFRRHPKARPSTRVALERYIGTALGGKPAKSAVQDLIAALEGEGALKISGTKVEYPTPPE